MDVVLQKIVDTFRDEQPEKIILFGSRAYGDPRKDSDYDICIIKSIGLDSFKEESLRLYKKLRRSLSNEITDLVLYTPEQYEERKDIRLFVTYDISRKGIVLYEKGSH